MEPTIDTANCRIGKTSASFRSRGWFPGPAGKEKLPYWVDGVFEPLPDEVTGEPELKDANNVADPVTNNLESQYDGSSKKQRPPRRWVPNPDYDPNIPWPSTGSDGSIVGWTTKGPSGPRTPIRGEPWSIALCHPLPSDKPEDYEEDGNGSETSSSQGSDSESVVELKGDNEERERHDEKRYQKTSDNGKGKLALGDKAQGLEGDLRHSSQTSQSSVKIAKPTKAVLFSHDTKPPAPAAPVEKSPEWRKASKVKMAKEALRKRDKLTSGQERYDWAEQCLKDHGIETKHWSWTWREKLVRKKEERRLRVEQMVLDDEKLGMAEAEAEAGGFDVNGIKGINIVAAAQEKIVEDSKEVNHVADTRESDSSGTKEAETEVETTVSDADKSQKTESNELPGRDKRDVGVKVAKDDLPLPGSKAEPRRMNVKERFLSMGKGRKVFGV